MIHPWWKRRPPTRELAWLEYGFEVMPEALGRSPIHHIVSTLTESLKRLGVVSNPLDVERCAFTIHRAISSRSREFHTHDHVLELAQEIDPIGVIAALYHDLVYVQVDLGLPDSSAALLDPLLRREEKGWRILEGAETDPVTRDVLRVFGMKVDDVLTAFSGLNELASAFVAAKELAQMVTRDHRVALAACIEATIPFRDEVGVPLSKRLEAMGLPPSAVHHHVTLAVRLANSDVGNFAEEDSARFLDNTWKLLPETNPALHAPKTYTVVEYRTALLKMEKFLSSLSPQRVFHEWGGEPSAEVHERRCAAAARNISLAARYLRQKLYSIAVVEALCLETGGDMPLDFFMGGLPDPEKPPMRRVEQYLHLNGERVEVDPVLHALLEGGRDTATRFDTSPSPLAAYLHASVGEVCVTAGIEEAKAWWAGQSTAAKFLASQPKTVTTAIASAASHIADTRREPLLFLAERLKGDSSRSP